ncbi:MAG: hypothetical protein V3V20_11890 [Algisphaera sp.]
MRKCPVNPVEVWAQAWRPGLAWAWRHWRVLGAVVVLLYVAGFNGQWRITPDSALYANVGRSLAAGQGMINGQGLADDSPVGLPGMFALLGGPGWMMQGFMLACAAAVLGLSFAVMRRVAGVMLAWGVVLLTATNHLFFEQTTNLLTEMPFAVGLMLVCLGHEWRRAGLGWPAALRAWGLIGLGFAIMAVFRSVAAVVAAAYVAAEVWDALADPAKRRRGMGVLLAGAGALATAWFFSPAVRDDVGLFYWHVKEMDFARSGENLWALLTEHLVEVTLGMDADAFTATLVSLVLIAGGVMLLKVRRFWGVLWIACLVQWVVFLPEGRYALPLIPLLMMGLLAVLGAMTQRILKPHRARVRGVMLGAVVLGNLVGVGDVIRDQRAGAGAEAEESDFYNAYRNGKYAALMDVGQTVQAMNLPTDAVVACPEGLNASELSAVTLHPVVNEDDLAALSARVWLARDGDAWRVGERFSGWDDVPDAVDGGE